MQSANAAPGSQASTRQEAKNKESQIRQTVLSCCNQDVLPAISYDYMTNNGVPPVDSEAECPAGSSSLQPAVLLNREAMRGKFSLQSILSTDHIYPSHVSEESLSIQTQDVITLGFVNLLLAEYLFQSFMNFWKVLLASAFGYGNIQAVAISGSETRNPRKIIPAATRKTFYRVIFFYILSIFVVGLIVPFDDPALNISTGTAQ
ncbi:hypothetical protein B7463_g4997, partial [Scytalidium lignicola]